MRRQIALLAVALALGATVIWIPWIAVRYVASFVLLWGVSGVAWAMLIPDDALDRLEWWCVALGLSWVVTPCVTLLGSYLPGRLTRATLLGILEGIIVLPVVCSMVWRRHRGNVATSKQTIREGLFGSARFSWRQMWDNGMIWLLAALLIAAGLRLINLSYSEFQGDEATVLVRAARALEGDEGIVFQHTKGPAELLVVMAGWRLTGGMSEWMTRLPFAWAGLLGLAAVMAFGRRLGHPHAGGIAACLLAINGYYVAFGRIVQYQSLVFVLSTLGLLCLLAYRTGGQGMLVSVGAALFAGGFLARYDAALALPAGLVLIGERVWSSRQRPGRTWASVAIGGCVGLVLIGIFYLPFLNSGYVNSTLAYLSGRAGGGQHIYNNLASTIELSVMYNSVYYLAVMALILLTWAVLAWSKWGRPGVAIAGVLTTLLVTELFWPQVWREHLAWSWAPLTILLAGALIVTRQSGSMHTVWIWLGAPAVLYLFLVSTPWTHIHVAFPAWSILCGLGIVEVARRLARCAPVWRCGVITVGAACYLLCGAFVVQVFVQHTPEYLRTFPQFKSRLYWTPYEQVPQDGLFGFPYRAGWNVVGDLIDKGYLAGSQSNLLRYNSNEEPAITDYYTRQSMRLGHGDVDMYIIAQNVQDEVNIHWEQVQAAYKPAVVVTVSGQPKLTVYRQDAAGEPVTLAAEDYQHCFGPVLAPDQVSTLAVEETQKVNLEDYEPIQATFGNAMQLIGYRVNSQRAAPGGYVEVDLLWQGLSKMPIDYHVFIHLYDGQTMYGQIDGQPRSGTYPTSRWQPGEIVADTYRASLQDDTLPATLPLLIGLYDYWTMQRLQVVDAEGQPIGDALHLTDVVMRP